MTQPFCQSRPRRVKAACAFGGQDHFYLEGQKRCYHSGRGTRDVLVYCSTCGVAETQHMVAHALARSSHSVAIEVRRNGWRLCISAETHNQCGAGGHRRKEAEAPSSRLDRDEGHDRDRQVGTISPSTTMSVYDEGRILGIEYTFALRAGFSPWTSQVRWVTVSVPPRQRLLLPACAAEISAALQLQTLCRTMAFRGFRRAAGMVGAKRVIDEVAVLRVGMTRWKLQAEFLRRDGGGTRNLRSITRRSRTASSSGIVAELKESADYAGRRMTPSLQCQQPGGQARAGADAGEARHLHQDRRVQPGRRAGTSTPGWFRCHEPWRHRRWGSRACICQKWLSRKNLRSTSTGEDHRHHYGQGAPTLADCRPRRARTSTHGYRMRHARSRTA